MMNSYLYNKFHILSFPIFTFSKNFVADEIINSHHFAVENDGLSENKVYDLFQGSEGYMWIGASNGLNKYDGNSKESWFREC